MKREQLVELKEILETIRHKLGIRDDFCPLGVALELEPVIRRALKIVESTDKHT